MIVQRQRFSSWVDSDLLATLRELAKREGRRLDAVLEDAMRDYITAHRVLPVSLDGVWPVHPTARWPEGLSLRREDMYEERVAFPEGTDSEPTGC